MARSATGDAAPGDGPRPGEPRAPDGDRLSGEGPPGDLAPGDRDPAYAPWPHADPHCSRWTETLRSGDQLEDGEALRGPFEARCTGAGPARVAGCRYGSPCGGSCNRGTRGGGPEAVGAA